MRCAVEVNKNPRKNAQSQVAPTTTSFEELIFKPMLQINGHDFSDKVKMAKPIWQDGLITLPKQPLTDIQYAQFNDAILLNQMTFTDSRSSSYRGYGTRALVVYLLVPEGIEIEVFSESTIQYVSE